MSGLQYWSLVMRLAGWVGILGHMPILVGVRHVYIAGGVPANEVPMHWVNHPDSTCFNNTDGEICCFHIYDRLLCVQHVGCAVERVNLLGLY
jgi:hypothetical protein